MYRLTLDLDQHTNQQALTTLEELRQEYPENPKELRLSARGGIHIIVYNAEKDWEKLIKQREKYGDDPKRIAIDKDRHNHHIETQVLFTRKKDHEAQTIWRGK